jgi:prepilin-type N-terminal cleavage/methylation domain-containing protein
MSAVYARHVQDDAGMSRSIAARPRRRTRGVSLVEVLVVLGIIAIMSAIVIPVAIRNGWMTSSKSALAARELFTLLKAASVYASTYNAETALAYGGRIVRDSELDELVPVADTLVLARRLKREEIIALIEAGHAGLQSPDNEIYVPVLGPEGVVRPLPNRFCVLPDLFTVVEVPGGYISDRGLRGVLLYDVAGQFFLEPRANLDYALDDYDPNDPDDPQPASFPAHVFKVDGSIAVDPRFAPQRFGIRVGPLPDQGYADRFHVKQDFALERRPVDIVFNVFDGVTPPFVDTFYSTDPADGPNTFADIDVEVELFVPTGRVRMHS